MSQFSEQFNAPMDFSDNLLVISGEYSREEAAELFSECVDDFVDPKSLTIDRVRFRLGVIDDEVVNSWFLGAKESKWSRAVWVY